MKRTAQVLTAGLVCLASAAAVQASSHREAPFIAGSPKVDGTDFYMFRSYESGRAGFVTLIANYQPLQDAYGGPNYFTMDPDALYEIHVDNNGNAIEDITFQFRFTNSYGTANIPSLGIANGKIPVSGGPSGGVQAPLALIGGGDPMTPGSTGAINVTENFTVKMVRGNRRTGAVTNVTNVTPTGGVAAGATTFVKPVDNIGQKSIPDYAAYAANYVYDVALNGCATNARLFVGQRREGFVVNLGQVFDQINLNPLGARDSASNTIGDKNVTSLALEVPVSCLTNGTEPVIGAWTTASKRQGRLLNPSPVGPVASSMGKGPSKEGGAWTQVSRLGSPLVNEVVIGITDKDKFNASEPKDDVSNFGAYVLYPTLPVLVNVLFGVTPPATPRYDLAYAFVTGIRTSVNGTQTDFTHPAGVNLDTLAGAGEMLRLNTAFPTAATAVAPAPDLSAVDLKARGDLGFLACDLNGFPNGRRVVDDVVDIALTVAEGTLAGANGTQTCDVASSATPSISPTGSTGAIVNDGALPSAADYLTAFPYLNTPIPGATSSSL